MEQPFGYIEIELGLKISKIFQSQVVVDYEVLIFAPLKKKKGGVKYATNKGQGERISRESFETL